MRHSIPTSCSSYIDTKKRNHNTRRHNPLTEPLIISNLKDDSSLSSPVVTSSTYVPSKRSKYKTWTENLKRKNLADYSDIMGSKPLDLKRFSTSSDKKNFSIKIVCDHCGDRTGLKLIRRFMSHGPYSMVHIVLSIQYGPYNMSHIA